MINKLISNDHEKQEVKLKVPSTSLEEAGRPPKNKQTLKIQPANLHVQLTPEKNKVSLLTEVIPTIKTSRPSQHSTAHLISIAAFETSSNFSKMPIFHLYI